MHAIMEKADKGKLKNMKHNDKAKKSAGKAGNREQFQNFPLNLKFLYAT